MKPSINKLFLVALLACSLAACSDDKPQPAPEKPQETAAPAAPQTPAETPKPAAEKPAAQPKPQPKKNVVYTAAQLAARLKEWDQKLSTLAAEFKQTTSYDGVEVSRSQGALFYDQGQNFLRLDTFSLTGETEQSAITDKKEIIILDETGAKVTTLSWKEWQQGQPNQALFDFGNYTALVDNHNAAVQS
ncbi:MAG: outer membrane lipoprotein carrier protein LolA, partial [Candidatus Avelusimicrobium sp.]